MDIQAQPRSKDAQFWDKIAVKYSRQPVQDPNAFERKIAIIVSLMRPTDEVLDLGCGTGSLALRLAPFAAHVHGLDFSREMIRIAREKVLTLGVPNVSFRVGSAGGVCDAENQGRPFGRASFDGITACSLLHLIDDRKAVLEQIHHLLKPGGFFVSSTVCLGESKIPYGGILSAMRFFGQAPMVHVLSERPLLEEIRGAGFVEVHAPNVGAEKGITFVVARKGDG